LEQPGNVLTCTLNAGAQLDNNNEDIVLVDACDTIERTPQSVDNDATIFLDGAFHDTDQANPSVPDCEPGDVTLMKDNDAGGSVEAGGTFNWIITVTVTGGLVNSVITDTIPDGFTINDVDESDDAISCEGAPMGQEITCGLVDLNPGIYTITIDVTAPGSEDCGPYTNEAEVTNGDGEGETAEDEINVICPGQPGLTVIKEGPDEIVSGEEITYTITITSIGDADAVNVVLTDELPDALSDIAAEFEIDDGGAEDCDVTGNEVTCDIGTLEPDDVAEVTITAIVEGCDPLENSATVSFGTEQSTEITLLQVQEVTSNTVVTEVLCGSITIVKEVPGTDPQDFDFDDDIPGCSIGTLDDHSSVVPEQSATCSDLEPGEYEITEDVPDGWVLDDIECTGADESTIEEIDNGVIIDLVGAEHITCTFFNVKEKASPTPTKTKTPTATPTKTPTPTATPRPDLGGVIGAIIGAIPTQQPPVAAAPQQVAPPSTGDSGLLDQEREGSSWLVYTLPLLVLAGTLVVSLALARIRREP
jgi:uncharacterized repeat protein (TIGR01451 family)